MRLNLYRAVGYLERFSFSLRTSIKDFIINFSFCFPPNTQASIELLIFIQTFSKAFIFYTLQSFPWSFYANISFELLLIVPDLLLDYKKTPYHSFGEIEIFVGIQNLVELLILNAIFCTSH